MLRLFVTSLPFLLASKSCFFCSCSSDDQPSRVNDFASVQVESEVPYARDGSSLERAEGGSTATYGATSSYTSLAKLLETNNSNNKNKHTMKRSRERGTDPRDIFESFDTLNQMEEDYPLCKYFDRKLRSSNSHRYVPAVRWSRVLGGPEQNCRKRDFRVGSMIGKGAFGRVVKATHKVTGLAVALKYIPYDTENLEAMSELRQEECLQHRMEDFKPVARHFCTFDISNDEGEFVVLVLEHIEGDELFHVIYGNSPRWPSYDQDNLLTWTAQLIVILRELHARNVVILDLKPENLILERNGNLRLIDFGLAGDPTRPSEFSFGRNLGTPMYYPPEFIYEEASESSEGPGEDRHQFSTDWYCLGLTLFEILYKAPPFDTSDAYELYRKIKYQGPVLMKLPTEGEMFLADLIAGFTDKDIKRRLGVHPDSDEYLAQHPFFRGINIDTFRLLYRRTPKESLIESLF